MVALTDLWPHTELYPALTEAINELSEVNERVCVLVEQPEEADSKAIGVCATGPGKEHREQPLKLFQVHAVLLQVGQTRVMTVHWVTRAAPVTAGQVFGLEGSAEEEKHDNPSSNTYQKYKHNARKLRYFQQQCVINITEQLS